LTKELRTLQSQVNYILSTERTVRTEAEIKLGIQGMMELRNHESKEISDQASSAIQETQKLMNMLKEKQPG